MPGTHHIYSINIFLFTYYEFSYTHLININILYRKIIFNYVLLMIVWYDEFYTNQRKNCLWHSPC